MSLIAPLGSEFPVLSYGLGGWRFLGVPTDDPTLILAALLGFNGGLKVTEWL
jgi:hypothetical protein